MSSNPWGEDPNNTGNDTEKFATYTRDSATGLDYADQRYYTSQFGRFMSADPYKGSQQQGEPASWNRFAYVQNDPVNHIDTRGLVLGETEPWDDCNHWDGCECEQGRCFPNPMPVPSPRPPPQPQRWLNAGTDKGASPASPQDRLRDLIWMGQELGDLRAFSTTNTDCLSDLGMFGLDALGVKRIASAVRTINIKDLETNAQGQFDPGADMTAITNQDTKKNFIVYNADNFWQTSKAQMAGTLLHEMIHLADKAFTDSVIGARLGVKLTSSDTSAISVKLAKDRF